MCTHNTDSYRDQTVDLQGYMTVCTCTGPRCCPLQIYSETRYRRMKQMTGGVRKEKDKHGDHSLFQHTHLYAMHAPLSALTCILETYNRVSALFFNRSAVETRAGWWTDTQSASSASLPASHAQSSETSKIPYSLFHT